MIWSLDIETKNVDISNLSFDDPKGWEISCICIVNEDNDIYTFTSHNDYLLLKDSVKSIFRNRLIINDTFQWYRKSFVDLEQFIYDLEFDEEEDNLIITKNGAKFDFPIIEKYLGISFEGINHHDIEKHIFEQNGERYRLSELIKYHIGKEEGKLLEAKYAPTLWSQGYYEVVVGYCIDDCYKTLQVYNDAKMKGFYSAIDRQGMELKKVLF